MVAVADMRVNLVERGYSVTEEYAPELEILEVAGRIGAAITPWEGGLVQTLQPRVDATPNTYSGNFGLDRFPFHTDLAHWKPPPRYLLLRCQVGYEDVPTLLIDGQRLIASISRNALSRALFKPRRPRNGALTLIRLLETRDGFDMLRWDEIFLRPASRVGEAVDQLVRDWLKRAEPTAVALFRPGDTLIIDNWRMLHARSPIPDGREDRSIQRVYLEDLH
ncbi:TauD/TfdA family dioxygenase [Aquabacter sp. CN5-332]|uniref:TauD/TfdA family dioxygenase n=1 Tax=Aquabacter sp. CN5-332 TaxID=3156608 RepID=UPI0032B3946D